jgi:hypothetical protein
MHEFSDDTHYRGEPHHRTSTQGSSGELAVTSA